MLLRINAGIEKWDRYLKLYLSNYLDEAYDPRAHMIVDLNIERSGPRLKVKFYGTRGSIPMAHPDYLEFGGNTTCIAVYSDDRPELVSVVDAGTGIRNFGRELKQWPGYDKIQRITMAFTHFHWDHIQGFPFFDPAYDPNIQVRVMAMGIGRESKNLREIFSLQMQEKYFPVSLEEMGSKMHFVYPRADVRVEGDAKVEVIEQNHPGGSWGYKLELGNRIIVICTDLEHSDGIDERIVEFVKGADLLVHEAQFTSEELLKHKGWGHSSYDQAMEVARRAGVGYLVMTHHDPDHDDTFLKDREVECQKVLTNCMLAREGMTVVV